MFRRSVILCCTHLSSLGAARRPHRPPLGMLPGDRPTPGTGPLCLRLLLSRLWPPETLAASGNHGSAGPVPARRQSEA